MLYDGITLTDSSTADNLTISSGSTLPDGSQTQGELFYQSGVGLFVFDGAGWVKTNTANDGSSGPKGDTGAQGPAGADGAQGPAGADGAQGPAGADGAQGPAGLAGAPGVDGAQGIQGIQGPKGDKGDPGSTTGDAQTDFTAKNLTVAADQAIGGNLTIAGNLNVQGTVTTVNSEVITTSSNVMNLNTGESGVGVTAGTAGISIDRGTAPDAQVLFNEADDTFKLGLAGALETIATRPWVTTNTTPSSHVGSGGESHAAATTSVAGFMSPTDKAKLDSLSAGITQTTGDARYLKLAGGTVTSLSVTNPIGGSVTGTASNVTGTVAIATGGTGSTTAAGALTALGAAPLASPALSGTPTAPTPAAADNSTKLATTAYVKSQGYLTSVGTISNATYAATAGNISGSGVVAVTNGGTGTNAATGTGAVVLSISPALGGTPSAPTPALDSNSGQLATTAFVKSQGYVKGSHNDANAVTFTDSNKNVRTFPNFQFTGTVGGAGPGGNYVPSTLAIGGTNGYQSTISLNSNYSNSVVVSNSGLVLNGNGNGVFLQSGGTNVVTVAAGGASVAGTLSATNLSGPLTGSVTGNVTGNLLGTPTAPTPTSTDNSTRVATTSYVKAQGFLGTASSLTTAGHVPYLSTTNTVTSSGNLTMRQNYGAGPGGAYSDTIVNLGTADGFITHLNLGGTNMGEYAVNGEGVITAAAAFTLRSKTDAIYFGIGNTNYMSLNTSAVNVTIPLTVANSVSATSFSGAGTGLTGTAASLNIGGNAATATTAASVSTVIPVAKGGTGVSTLTGYVKGAGAGNMTAASTIPFSDVTGTVGVAQGGTGATTAAGALVALGAAPTLSPTFTGTVTVPTVTAGDSSTAAASTAFVSNAVANVAANATGDFKKDGSLGMTGNLKVAAGTSTVAPVLFAAGSQLTTPTAHAMEWNGTNLSMTNSGGTRKTIAYVDSNITGTAAAANSLVEDRPTSIARFVNPVGASFGGNVSSTTGAIKIKLPLVAPAAAMIQMTVKLYEYSGGATTGNSRTLIISGYTDDGTIHWANCSAAQLTVGGGDINVRFGKDATTHCVWIGEVGQTWAFPQVTVTDIQVGYANGTAAVWNSGWAISFVTSFDTVSIGPAIAGKNLTSQNIGSYAPTMTGAGASGTWGISVTGTAANVTGTVAIANGGTGATTAAAAVIALGVPYDVAGMILGKPTASAVILRFVTPRAFNVPAAMAGSIAKSAVTATASTVFNVQKNNTTFGTITFAAGAAVGTFAAASSTTFAVGDVFTVVAPATQDATFADGEFTVVANLV